MPKHLAFLVAISALALCGCTSLSHLEQREYKSLEFQGVSLQHPAGNYTPPNNAILAGALNLFPGFGNFYLAVGKGSDGTHAVYGVVNLLFWPLSIIWSVPEAAYDAIQLNKSDMLYFYRYAPEGKKALEELGIHLE